MSLIGRIRRNFSFIGRTLSWVNSHPEYIKNKRSVLKDYLHLYRKKGLTWDEYYSFEFERREDSFRESFLGMNEQCFYLDYLNPKKYYSLARNKYLAHKMLEDAGIRKAELYCYYCPEARFSGSSEKAGNIHDVLRILKGKQVCSCVIKTSESSHGNNVWVITKIVYGDNDAEIIRYDGVILQLSSILGEESLVFESIVKQTKQLADFNASSVNTIRFMTTLYPDGTARIIATFLKIGRKGSCVDNAGNGGNIDAAIDNKTGRIYYAIQFNGWRDSKDIEYHPDNGKKLNGIYIDNWDSIRADVIRCQQAFPYCKAAGWDIAITDEGPVVIEVNDFWDRTGQLFIRRGWREEIRDCFMAWKQTGKDYSLRRDLNALSNRALIDIVNNK